MIVAENPRFVFVHVHKTGGTSIKRVLRRYAMKPGHELANQFLKRIGIRQFSPVYYPNHFTANQLIERIGSVRFGSYYSFGFVRNPWDWQVSTYRYILRNRKHPHHKIVVALKEFGEYLRWRCDERFQLQRDFLYQDDKQVVDFIGRFENLTEDFQSVCRQLKLRHRLPVLNRTGGKRYESYYTEYLKELVQTTYRPDIEEFGYQFEKAASKAA